ncbi:MAG: hypothetical protein ABJB22_01130 [Verrucomicrobiota bacterium]
MSAWDPASPAFHVSAPPVSAAGVRKHFRCENVYYASSHQGCSCAFNCEHEHESILQLRDYLREALASGAEIEAFVCRIGREEDDVRHAVVSSPEGIALPGFFFKDGQFLVIQSPHPSRARRKFYPAGAMSDFGAMLAVVVLCYSQLKRVAKAAVTVL